MICPTRMASISRFSHILYGSKWCWCSQVWKQFYTRRKLVCFDKISWPYAQQIWLLFGGHPFHDLPLVGLASVPVGRPKYENNVKNRQTGDKPLFHMTLMSTWWLSCERQKESSKHTRRTDVHHSHNLIGQELTKPLLTREYQQVTSKNLDAKRRISIDIHTSVASYIVYLWWRPAGARVGLPVTHTRSI